MGRVVCCLVAYLCVLGSVRASEPELSLGRALQAALAANPDVLIVEARIDGAAGAVSQARGIFDPVATATAARSDDNRPLSASEAAAFPSLSGQLNRASSLGVGVEQRTATGVSVFGNASAAYLEDRLSGAVGTPSQTTGRVALGVRLPLARGSGARYVGAGVRAAERELEAALAQRRHTVSLALRDTAAAYWEYVTRWRQLDIARAGEQRTSALVDELRRLLAADEIPVAELDLAIANATERANNRIASEQALLDAQQALGRLMGLERFSLGAIARPASDFPSPSAAGMRSLWATELADHAERLRDDLRAQDLRLEAARERVLQARDLVRPLVDVSVSVGVSALREGAALGTYANPFPLGGSGPSVSLQLGAQYPFGNRAALGLVGQTNAAAVDLEIRRRALLADIAAGVRSAADGLARAAQQLAAARDLVGHYTRALEAERIKRRLGMATLIDVIAVEDRLQNAQLADIERQRNYAVAIVRLNHELGTLIRPGRDEFDVREADFLEYRAPRHE